MTVDIRAKIMCDLGEVISGGWSDDHVQGTGLIRTRGDVVLKDLYNYPPGTPIRLAYYKDGKAVRFPRALRVLSCFADPFRRQTTLQLGCRLTWLENLAGATNEDRYVYTWDDLSNSTLECTYFDNAVISISAEYVAKECLTKLQIPHGNLGLTNYYAKEKFDISSGYVNVLSELLQAESKVGYLTASETLIVLDINNLNPTYANIAGSKIIDLSPVNSGEVPGDAVSVSYSTKRFIVPPEEPTEEERQKRNWELDVTTGPPERRIIIPRTGPSYVRTFLPVVETSTIYDSFDRVVSRTTQRRQHIASANPSYIKWRLENGFTDEADGVLWDIYSLELETHLYRFPANLLSEPAEPPGPGQCRLKFGADELVFDPERDNEKVQEVKTVYESEIAVAGRVGFEAYGWEVQTGENTFELRTYEPSKFPNIVTSTVNVIYEKDSASGITKTTTSTIMAAVDSPEGNQGAAAQAFDVTDIAGASITTANASALVNTGSTVSTRVDRLYGVQRRPSAEERKNLDTTKLEETSVSKVEFIYGTESAENVTTYSLPSAPDDRVSRALGSATGYRVTRSDAEVKARNYGRAQHKLTFGHRNGFSIQLSPVDIPPNPLDGLSIAGAGNLVGAYRCNGISWTFDSTGIICNTDALFWGGIGIQP
jgi:hypothetical protein